MGREGITGRILSELLLFSLGSGLGILLVEDAKNAGGDLVVNNGFVVFSDDVDAKFLMKCRGLYNLV